MANHGPVGVTGIGEKNVDFVQNVFLISHILCSNVHEIKLILEKFQKKSMFAKNVSKASQFTSR